MKSKKQYIVLDANVIKREELYNYLEKEKYIFIDGNKEYYVNSKFPFVIEKNIVWICNSITCCACAARSGAIMTIEKYFDEINNFVKKMK